ncbi:dihydroxyacetone kinase subunit DhaL [Halothermothrix orenii]|uniref:phosphoenolpyruvate--glycerone phosphotransferase n=1 Tax=Halothermothrix orenii (strain H 168 / OCM 544 / DSM 9562) TaxID=373903 RepID=B8D1L0_HALOH|nr:dihydroxyacetone kinase subunit DhaL [Halothermothrix orenii]ACL69087.1 Glycerone kinase [Halothermothrix orenii H 168]
MEYFLNSSGGRIVYSIIEAIQDNKEYLSEIDGAIGDGDHGINMNKGVTMTKEKLDEQDEVDLATALKTLGFTVVSKIGGSMGPLYGNFFLEMSKAINGREKIDKKVFSDMLNAALEGVKALGDAKVGDKTMMDTLIPAVKTYDKAIEGGKGFKEALEEMQVAAEKGKESTKDLVAKVGRAARLGERSRGVLDAGATSCNLILQAMANTIRDLLISE